MIQRFTLSSLFFVLFCASAGAQDTVRLSIPDVDVVNSDDPICVPVIADTFVLVAGVQFSVAWDTSELEFVEVNLGDNPLSLDDSRATRPAEFPDNYGVIFTTTDLQGITLPPATEVFRVCFEPVNVSGTTEVTFDGYLAPEFIKQDSIVRAPFIVTSGTVTYDNTTSVSEPAWAASLSVFPNPVAAGEMISIGGHLPRLESISLGDAEGRIVRSFPGVTRHISTSDLPAGVYWLRLGGAKENVVRRVVIR